MSFPPPLRPWESIATSSHGPSATSPYSIKTRILPAKDGIAVSLCLVDSRNCRSDQEDQMRTVSKSDNLVPPNMVHTHNNICPEGDYVEFAKDKVVTAQDRTWNQHNSHILKSSGPTSSSPPQPGPSRNHTPCIRTVRFAEEPCTPCMSRKLGQETKEYDLKCRYRVPHMEVQQNSMNVQRGCTLGDLKEQDSCIWGVELENERRRIPGSPPFCYLSEKSCKGQPVSQVLNGEHGDTQTKLQMPLQDPSSSNQGTINAHMQTEKGISEKCWVVVQRDDAKDNKDSCQGIIPRLCVMQGKKTTAFGLVSPKVGRRRLPNQEYDPQVRRQPSSPMTGQQSDIQVEQANYTDTTKPGVPSLPQSKSSIHLIQLRIACLPGSRDRAGRAMVELYGDNEAWSSSLVSSLELSKLLLYFYSIIRKEELGMTLVLDAQKKPPHPEFYKALLMLHEQCPHSIHGVLILMNKETSYSPEKCPGLMVDIVTSLRTLHRTVEGSQLTSALGGTFPYSHSHWIEIHQKLHPFVLDLQDASNLVLGAIRRLEGVHKIDTVQDVQQCIKDQKTLMSEVLKDTQLVALQREGGAKLAKLRRESDLEYPHCANSRDCVDTVTGLYHQLEEQVHVLVRKFNVSLEHLDFLLKLREMETQCSKIKKWLDAERERHLLEAESLKDSREGIQEILQSFNTFLSEVNEKKHQAVMLMTEAEKLQGPSCPETEVFRPMVSTFKSNLADIFSHAELCCSEFGTMVNLLNFCQQAIELASNCRAYLGQEQFHGYPEEQNWTSLKEFYEQLGNFSSEHFQEVKAHACSLGCSRVLQVWNEAWLNCQDVRKQLEERLQELDQAQRIILPPDESCDPNELNSPETDHMAVDRLSKLSQTDPESTDQSEDDYCRPTGSSLACFHISFRQNDRSPKGSGVVNKKGKRMLRKETDQGKATNTGLSSVACDWLPQQHRLHEHVGQGSSAVSGCSEPQVLTPSGPLGYPCQIAQDSQYIQTLQHAGLCSENSSCIERESRHTLELPASPMWTSDRAKFEFNPEVRNCNITKLHRIMEELLSTELEYVHSLSYTITHYLPLLAQPSVPQELRGQRGQVFSNLEKIHEFHCHYFLKELEACRTEPLRVGCCFLRHRESFGLYALYTQNKPQSDALVLTHGREFFKRKQLELGDSMDLFSYLLKPVQRVSQYSLLLQDIFEECGPNHDREREEIQGAIQVVRFQLRHGNDLLTMDAIKECNVNLKEQGQLIRQDEFSVFFRKKKSLRRAFLFQDLILLSKTKKTDHGDVYVYKQSFKTCDIGMTHSSGESGLCFEIWVHRRKTQDTYILQAETKEIKEAWTRDLEHILWEQAVRSRELRMQERVFMGILSKPFMDIQPSEAAISNRAIICGLPGIEGKASLISKRECMLPRPSSFGSGSSSSNSGSHLSSSSGHGSLPPAVVPGSQPNGGGYRKYSCQGILVDSTASSVENMTMFTRLADQRCLSATEANLDCSSPVFSLCSDTRVLPTSTVEIQQNDTLAVSRRKPSIIPHPCFSSQSPQQVREIKKTTDV